MPHKVAILEHLDELTPEGRTVGAVNTLFIRQDPITGERRYMGTNTDVIGVRDSFVYNVKDAQSCYHGRPALVVGGGGAARSAVYALRKWMQVTKIYLVNRDREEVQVVIDECTSKGYGEGLIDVSTVEQAEQLEGVGAIVTCVPDFPPQSPAELEARKVLECFLQKSHKGALLEMCYHPSPRTQIVKLGEQAGWQVILGTEAMIYQGIAQDSYWTGKSITEMPVESVHKVIAGKLREPRL